MTQDNEQPIVYKILVHEDFTKELDALAHAVKLRLKKKLEKVVQNPHIPKNRLSGELHNCYKIKLRADGVRLIYQVNDDEIYILLLTLGKRADGAVYDVAKGRV